MITCTYDPSKIVGPIGQFHCPLCGEMVVAGCPHPDYDRLNHLTEEDIKVIRGETKNETKSTSPYCNEIIEKMKERKE